LDVDATANIADGREGGVVESTGPVDGSTDSINFIETANDFEVSVVCNEECSADGGEIGEGEV